MTIRVILHLDLDAFFASVEILENPELAGKPVLVGGRPEERGVVAAASYPARAFGCRSAMPMAQALKLCPEAIVLPPRHGLYRQVSKRVMAILHEVTPLVEQISIDEAFLDVSEQAESWEDAVALAQRLQARVRDEIGLSASLGVATNKQVAKVASDLRKPGGLTIVPPGTEAEFLAPLPARALWGVGPVTAGRLAEMGVTTVGELAALPSETLRAAFGKHGPELSERARGIDDSPVVTEYERKSYSQERTFNRDLSELHSLKVQLWKMSKGVAEDLKRGGLAGSTVAIKLRYSDFTTLTRQMTQAVPTDDAIEIYRAALILLERAWEPGRPVRLLGVGAHQLSEPTGQLALFSDPFIP
jgi:DNA polymerase-4